MAITASNTGKFTDVWKDSKVGRQVLLMGVLGGRRL